MKILGQVKSLNFKELALSHFLGTYYVLDFFGNKMGHIPIDRAYLSDFQGKRGLFIGDEIMEMKNAIYKARNT